MGRIRHAVADYAASQGVEPTLIDDVALAVTEVVSNCIVHAYRESQEGCISVMASVDGGELTVRVIDEGIGLRPRPDSPGAGLGLSIAGKVARRMVVERPQRGGTAVCMTFRATS